MSKRFELDEDFVGAGFTGGGIFQTSTGPWIVSGVGTEAASMVASEADAPGIVRLATGTSSGDTCQITLTDGMPIGNGIVDFSLRFRPSSTSDITVIAGLFETTLAPVVDTARVLFYDTPSDSSLQSLARDSGGQSLIDLAVSPSTTQFRTIRFRTTADGALASTTVYSDTGTVLTRALHTARFPGAVQLKLGILVQTQTTASRFVEIDRVTLSTGLITR